MSGTPEPHSRYSEFLRNRLVLAGGAILVLLVLSALTAPLWVKAGLLSSPIQQFPKGLDEDGMPLGAGGGFLAGTDNLGRDVFSRVLFGTRVSLSVGVAAMLTATLIGVVVGVVAGFRGDEHDAAGHPAGGGVRRCHGWAHPASASQRLAVALARCGIEARDGQLVSHHRFCLLARHGAGDSRANRGASKEIPINTVARSTMWYRFPPVAWRRQRNS